MKTPVRFKESNTHVHAGVGLPRHRELLIHDDNIIVNCPECNAEIIIPKEKANEEITCDLCHSRIEAYYKDFRYL
jgi:uncharacterized paraquat-inducible protein A